jgi:2-polyprenyl-6-methoxyphenol hydroxylase-like FAD-dependent oxidoreductase
MIKASTATLVDVLIVGGGIAGASLACVLSTAGFGVALVEREAMYRDNVRGEGLHPWGYREVHDLDLVAPLDRAGATELPVWQLYTDRVPDEPFLWESDPVNPLPEVTVSHPALQEALFAEAARRGVAVFRPGRATMIAHDSTPEVDIASNNGATRIKARLIVGADGRSSTVRRWMGAKLVHDRRHHWLGGALFDRVTLAEGSTHGANFEGGRTFIFPQGRGVARAYLVASDGISAQIRGPERVKRFVDACADVMPEGAFDGARSIGPLAIVANNDVWSSAIAGENVILIGDAAGANDPSLGQGMSLVFRDVRELRDLLLDGRDWSAAIREFERSRREYFGVLRAHAQWTGILTVATGVEADQIRERAARAREIDPTAGGFTMIYSRGPDGLSIDEASRRRFFGEDVE